MKKKFLAFALLIAAVLTAVPALAGTIRLSSTIGPVDAGIVPLLADTYKAKTGVDFKIEKAGTGATLEKAKTGNFDMVVVHAKELEDKFIKDGFGQNRREFMYNDFVILGPKSDPAGIRSAKTAVEAFKIIAAIEVSPKRFPSVNNADVVKFVNWLCSDEAQTIIKDFKVKEYGQPLFFPNSDEWNRKHPK